MTFSDDELARLSGKKKKSIPFAFVLEELGKLHPRTRPMFGCTAVYVGEKIVLILRDKEGPIDDNGIWIATTKEHHDSLRSEFPKMRSIRVFGESKTTSWQVLPERDSDFESYAMRACELILAGDPRIGTVPASRAKRKPSARLTKKKKR